MDSEIAVIHKLSPNTEKTYTAAALLMRSDKISTGLRLDITLSSECISRSLFLIIISFNHAKCCQNQGVQIKYIYIKNTVLARK